MNGVARAAFALCAAAAVLALGACRREEAAQPVDTSKYVIADAATTAPAAPPAVLPRFVDVTEAAGVTFRHHSGAFGKVWMPETLGSGGGFFDYDGDGHPDLLLVNGSDWPEYEETPRAPGPQRRAAHTPELYRNDGAGRFEDVSARTGLDQVSFYGMGMAAADYDGDGAVDLFLTGVGRNYLLRFDRAPPDAGEPASDRSSGATTPVPFEGRYVDVTASRLELDPNAAAPGGVPDWSLGAAWVDYDLDGDLDLFVCNYVCWTPQTDVYTSRVAGLKSYATPEVYPGQTSRLFRNEGGGRLVEATLQAGLLNPAGKSMSVVVDDVDGDLLPDLFITNDTEANFLYRNLGGGRFEEIALAAGCGYDEAGRARAGMGTWTADLTNDGDLCIVIGNFSREPVSLYQRVRGTGGALVFVDAAARARLARPTLIPLTFGAVFADFDLDGYEDLMLANGHIEPEIARVQRDTDFAQSPQLFRNVAGEFDDLSDLVGPDFSRPLVGRALAYADIDGDGDLDVLITANNDRPRLLRNDLRPWPDRAPEASGDETPPAPGVLRVRLVGAGVNREAIGAAVTAYAGGKRMTRLVRTGGSYLAQSELVATFGLGPAARANVEVRWPAGRTDPVGPLEAGYEYTITEGRGVTAARPLARVGDF